MREDGDLLNPEDIRSTSDMRTELLAKSRGIYNAVTDPADPAPTVENTTRAKGRQAKGGAGPGEPFFSKPAPDPASTVENTTRASARKRGATDRSAASNPARPNKRAAQGPEAAPAEEGAAESGEETVAAGKYDALMKQGAAAKRAAAKSVREHTAALRRLQYEHVGVV